MAHFDNQTAKNHESTEQIHPDKVISCLLKSGLIAKSNDNGFFGVVDRQKAVGLTFSQDHCWRFSPSLISDKLQAELAPVVELSCAAEITPTPWCHLKH